ncbi:proteasome inhibitor PI31 subunit isoform X3 [Mauremys mutica]|nr:proteasome inhibitor PI31 subunit isoform X3 [Mauremys mutica]
MDDRHELLLKAIMVDTSMILNVMDCSSKQVADLTLTVADYIDPEHLADFHRVYKNIEELQTRVVTGIISPLQAPKEKGDPKKEAKPEKTVPPASTEDYDPLRIPPWQPLGGRQPSWPDPRDPFAVGGEDLDPFGIQRLQLRSYSMRTVHSMTELQGAEGPEGRYDRRSTPLQISKASYRPIVRSPKQASSWGCSPRCQIRPIWTRGRPSCRARPRSPPPSGVRRHVHVTSLREKRLFPTFPLFGRLSSVVAFAPGTRVFPCTADQL